MSYFYKASSSERDSYLTCFLYSISEEKVHYLTVFSKGTRGESSFWAKRMDMSVRQRLDFAAADVSEELVNFRALYDDVKATAVQQQSVLRETYYDRTTFWQVSTIAEGDIRGNYVDIACSRYTNKGLEVADDSTTIEICFINAGGERCLINFDRPFRVSTGEGRLNIIVLNELRSDTNGNIFRRQHPCCAKFYNISGRMVFFRRCISLRRLYYTHNCLRE